MHVSQIKKYRPFLPVVPKQRTWPDQVITTAPIWCSVDLRDGNQALVDPMGIEQKLAMFELLVGIGFKQIEIGFPSASKTEFDFCRRLIDERRIPADVIVQILCPARENLIVRSLEALSGASRVIFHLYNSTSKAQREHTFGMTREQVRDLALAGVDLIERHRHLLGDAQFGLEYSPESFSQTEADLALEICQAVKQAWQPNPQRPLIINLPSTVEVCGPNQYADFLEWFSENIPGRSDFTLSLHTHNDRGEAIAAAELGLLAGAQRIEGTLFGNGERTGNLDIVTMSLNMNSQGIATGLDFSNLPQLGAAYRDLTGMEIHPRHPYAGELVFTAFSGSHQDAIKKALEARKSPESNWDIPYLPIDPADIGRSYAAIIRINSQSGKGGVAYLLKQNYGITVPQSLMPELGNRINQLADQVGAELTVDQLWAHFQAEYLERAGILTLHSIQLGQSLSDPSLSWCRAEVSIQGIAMRIQGEGKGPLEAFVKGLHSVGLGNFDVSNFHEDAISQGVESRAAAWICVVDRSGVYWGLGIDQNITHAGIKALVSGINRIPVRSQTYSL